jgi:hypothetical protein
MEEIQLKKEIDEKNAQYGLPHFDNVFFAYLTRLGWTGVKSCPTKEECLAEAKRNNAAKILF